MLLSVCVLEGLRSHLLESGNAAVHCEAALLQRGHGRREDAFDSLRLSSRICGFPGEVRNPAPIVPSL